MSNIYQPPPVASLHRKALVSGILAVAAFLAVEALLLRSFARTDTRPPSWDQAIHMEIALDYRNALKDGKVADAVYLAPKPGMPPFPPLYHLFLMGSYSSPNPANAALWVNWLYLALLSASIFGIAWFFRPDQTAAAAVVMFAASTGVQELYTTQLIDLPTVALAAASYWALLTSDGFRKWVPALLFGVAHAAGMLHKWSFFSYMLPAYWMMLVATREKGSTVIMLSSTALSFALLFPWYSAHLALLPSRLVQASTDFAVPVWNNPSAWGVYLHLGSIALGPVLFIMGAIALLTPQLQRNREQGKLLLAWFLAAYVFWTIVPNRQARFLVPALVPLAVAFCSTWPKPATWTVMAFQLFSMFNFYGGWIGPVTIPMPYFDLRFFENRPAAAEDWKIETILRKIEAERDQSRPVTNVTLVANDHYFNGPTFHWMQKRLGLEHARMRGVNSRLCELSEFVLLKEPKLGPPSVIGGLQEAANEIREPRGWFSKAYEQIEVWALPDGSSATLFRQRRGLKKPYDGKTLVYQVFNIGKVDIIDLKAQFGQWDPAASVYKSATITAKSLDVRGLQIKDPDVELYDLGFVPVVRDGRGDDEWVDMRLMRLGRVRVNSLDVGAEELKLFLAERVKGLMVSEVILDNTVIVRGKFKGKAVAAEAALTLLDQPRRLKIDIKSAKWGGINVPLHLFREIKELEIPLYPNPETPFAIEMPGLTIKGGRLTIP